MGLKIFSDYINERTDLTTAEISDDLILRDSSGNVKKIETSNLIKSVNMVTGLSNVINGIYNDTDTDHDIGIVAGLNFVMSDGVKRTSTAMVKRIDATWAAGTGNGGLFTGTVAADTTYHFFMIYNPTTSVIEYGWDTSLTAANKPSGYTYFSRIWSFLVDASANIRGFSQFGNKCCYKSVVTQTPLTPANNDVTAITVNGAPSGINTNVTFQSRAISVTEAVATGESGVSFFDYDANPSVYQADLYLLILVMSLGAANFSTSAGNFTRTTDTSSRIKYKVSDYTKVSLIGYNLLAYEDITLQ